MSQQTVKKIFNNTAKIYDIKFASILNQNPTTFTYAWPHSHQKTETDQTNDTWPLTSVCQQTRKFPNDEKMTANQKKKKKKKIVSVLKDFVGG